MVFFIIFGTRGVTSTASRGHFFCPSCNTECRYEHKRVRRFFTIYFIPIIPLDVLGEYVECQQCRETFRESVLSYDPGAPAAYVEAEFHVAIKRVLADVMMATGARVPEETEAAQEVYLNVVGKELCSSDLNDEIDRTLREGAAGTIELLHGLGPRLSTDGKEVVIRSALWVAAADGEFQPQERALVQQLAHALQLSPAHLRGLTMDVFDPGTALPGQ